jgi:hypothetical protein
MISGMGEEQKGRLESGGRQVYVELLIRAPLERLWELSQDPELHPRWDLRFSRIVPLSQGADGLARFRYEFRLPFHAIAGTGTSLGHRHRDDGQSTSVLKFCTDDALSPIGPGSGYWRYIPTDQGIRFITGYHYRPGLGLPGRALDSGVIRPALGWATALSFDRLRLWAESGLDPRTARNRWLADAAARAACAVAAVVLLRRPLAGLNGGAVLDACLCVTAAAAALWFPSHPSVPRARRCLRRPPDRRSGLAPSALDTLPEPGGPPSGMASVRKPGSQL